VEGRAGISTSRRRACALVAVLDLCAAALALSGAASARGAWTSNIWHSPSGNIRCSYIDPHGSAGPEVECMTASPLRAATLSIGRGDAWRISPYPPVPLRGPVLGYGQSWRLESVTCAMRTSGVTCRNSRGGHGFFVAAQGIRIF
jgi:hypothetical protein